MKRRGYAPLQRTLYRIYFSGAGWECQVKLPKRSVSQRIFCPRYKNTRPFSLTTYPVRDRIRCACGCGGIGRLIGFRFQRASVQVRVLSSAPRAKGDRQSRSPFALVTDKDSNPSNCNMPVAYCCHQCKHWWLQQFPSRREGNANRVLSSAPYRVFITDLIVVDTRFFIATISSCGFSEL